MYMTETYTKQQSMEFETRFIFQVFVREAGGAIYGARG